MRIFNQKSQLSVVSCQLSARKRAGFTLIEMVVALSIVAVIAVVAVSYSGGTSRLLVLLRAQNQIVGMLNYVKSQSQNFTLNPPAGRQVCAYGVRIDRLTGEFRVFQDLVNAAQDCDDSDNILTAGEELSGETNVFSIDLRALEFVPSSNSAAPDITDIVFVPPNTDVIINGDTAVKGGSIILQVPNTTTKAEITVNSFAQITVQ